MNERLMFTFLKKPTTVKQVSLSEQPHYNKLLASKGSNHKPLNFNPEFT